MLYGREPRLPLDIGLTPPENLSPSVAEHREKIVSNLQRAYQIARQNTQRAQQAMKVYYDRAAKDPNFQVGERVWVFTPQLKKGLSRKLSPVHYRLLNQCNKPISTTVHANRMKLFYDREDRPIGQLLQDVEEDYLAEDDLPLDSFQTDDNATVAKAEHDNQAVPHAREAMPDVHVAPHEFKAELGAKHRDDETHLDDSFIIDNESVFRVENILATRLRGGKRQYLVKWEGYPSTENTWEAEDILDSQLIDNFSARQGHTGFISIAVYSICSRFSRVACELSSFLLLVASSYLLFSLLTLVICKPLQPQLGPIFDCSTVQEVGVFHLNYRRACRCNMHESTQPLTYFSAKIYSPHVYCTPILLFLCSAETRKLRCKESFFGSKSKSSFVTVIPVPHHLCKQVVATKQSPYRKLTRTKAGEWKTSFHDHYECHWLHTTTKSYPHFTITEYKGELIGDDAFIHQDLTVTHCRYNSFYCIPQELPKSAIVWHKVNHRTEQFQLLGNYTANHLEDFVLIPKLGIGGAVQSTSKDGVFIQLDNGYLCEKQHDNSSHKYVRFISMSAQFLKNAKPSLATDLLEAHITVALEMKRTALIKSWESIFNQEGELGRIKKWMISRFPDSSAEWVDTDLGYKVEVVGEGLIIGKCTPIYNYRIFWNRTFTQKCYQHFPVTIYSNLSTFFLKIPDRQITPHSPQIKCPHRPNLTIIEDISGHLWSISASGHYTLESSPSTLKPHPLYKIPKIRGFNSKLIRSKPIQMDHMSVLQVVTTSHATLTQLNHLSSEEGDGDILQGLGSIFGKAISAMSKGGLAIIKAVGHGAKEGSEGLGEFSEKVAHGMAESTGSLISSGGHAIHEAETGAGQFIRDSFGGIGGVILCWIYVIHPFL